MPLPDRTESRFGGEDLAAPRCEAHPVDERRSVTVGPGSTVLSTS